MALRVSLDDSVQYLRGVGPVRAREFATIGVQTVGDLIEHFPFRHELTPKSVPIGSLELGVTATVVGELGPVRSGRGAISARLVDGTGECFLRWFNSPFLADKLHRGSVVRLSGKVDQYRELASFTNPKLTIIEDDEDPFADDSDRHGPVYPATAQLPSKRIARIIDGVLDGALQSVSDFLPTALREKRKLPPRRTAILRYHKPTSLDDVPIARRRLAYDELFLCQLAVQNVRLHSRKSGALTIRVTDEIDRRIRRRFPFDLTAGQNQAIAEIRHDLAKDRPMNRLLQADVGAGKTVVAAYAALATVANGGQVAFLAPTEVLAMQHHAKIERYLTGSRVRLGLLTGSTSSRGRSQLQSELAAGKIDLLIGTHALLERSVRFRNLGFVVIDEQHKFGVAQRAKLRTKGPSPHTLVLTATPIPRTLAMTVFGDLDVSTIHGLPPGRGKVHTTLIAENDEPRAWAFVRSRLSAGEQAYIVYPLVEESKTLPLKAARVEAERLAQGELSGFKVELLHGRMRPADKADTMDRFRAGKIQALVATTVIEVGVDVSTATVMAVQHAERFGLCQLHQLRGRIGRGERESHCLLFASDMGETARARLNIMCATTDGFRIAEEDLRLRGPGEMLGTRQHGLPAFRVADLVADFDLLEQARDDAAGILREDPSLAAPRHRALRGALMNRYGDMFALADA